MVFTGQELKLLLKAADNELGGGKLSNRFCLDDYLKLEGVRERIMDELARRAKAKNRKY